MVTANPDVDMEFENLNAKVASGLYKLLDQSAPFRQKIRIMKEKFSKQYNKMLNGRQIFYMMIQHVQTSQAADGIHDFNLLLSILGRHPTT